MSPEPPNQRLGNRLSPEADLIIKVALPRLAVHAAELETILTAFDRDRSIDVAQRLATLPGAECLAVLVQLGERRCQETLTASAISDNARAILSRTFKKLYESGEQAPAARILASIALVEDLPSAESMTSSSRLHDSIVDTTDDTLASTWIVGRSNDLELLHNALHSEVPAVLVHGAGGIGKTSLLRTYVATEERSISRFDTVVFFSCYSISSIDSLVATTGTSLLEGRFTQIPPSIRARALTEYLRTHRVLVIWDGIDSILGDGDTKRTDLAAQDSRKEISTLFRSLRGGLGKVLVASRGSESWLGTDFVTRVSVSALDNKESRLLAARVAAQLGLGRHLAEPDFAELIDLLQGHPLTIRIAIPLLQQQTPRQLIRALRSQVGSFPMTDQTAISMKGAIRIAIDEMRLQHRSALVAVALHEGGVVDSRLLQEMAERVGDLKDKAQVEELTQSLIRAGFAHSLPRTTQGTLIELHPIFTQYLRDTVLAAFPSSTVELWTRAFVEVFAKMARHSLRQPSGFDSVPRIHLASLRHALELARRSQMRECALTLGLALAQYAMTEGDARSAERLYSEVVDWNGESIGDQLRAESERDVAEALYQLGVIAEDRLDLDVAESWYTKALAAEDRLNDHLGAAVTSHRLGTIALARRSFDRAQSWYLRAAEMFERHGPPSYVASTYHQLGILAQEMHDFDSAESWYKRSLEIELRTSNERGASHTFHQLGMVFQERRDFAAAESWYKRALEIEERLADEHGAASTYHQLGMMAQERQDFAAAEEWYKKSLEIKERLIDEQSAATTYHQLGIIAQEQRDFSAAENWYKKSLRISERLGNNRWVSRTYHQLGIVAQGRRDFAAAEEWYSKSLRLKEQIGDDEGVATTYHQLGMVAQERRDFSAAEHRYKKSLELEERLGDMHGAAMTMAQLGLLRLEQGDLQSSVQLSLRAAAAFSRCNSERMVVGALGSVARAIRAAQPEAQRELKALALEAGIPERVLEALLQVVHETNSFERDVGNT